MKDSGLNVSIREIFEERQKANENLLKRVFRIKKLPDAEELTGAKTEGEKKND